VSYGGNGSRAEWISDYADWAPRVFCVVAPGMKAGKKANTVLRAGYGWFYDGLAANVLSAIHGNGVNQQNYVVKNPTFTTDAPTAAELGSAMRRRRRFTMWLQVEGVGEYAGGGWAWIIRLGTTSRCRRLTLIRGCASISKRQH